MRLIYNMYYFVILWNDFNFNAYLISIKKVYFFETYNLLYMFRNIYLIFVVRNYAP